MVLIPNLKYIPDEAREVYLNKTIQRFAYIKWTGVIIVIMTGIIQWFDIYPGVVNKEGYLMAFALKMIAAVGLFVITFMLALPDERLKGMQRNRKFWSGLNLICALLILIGAALMRAVRSGTI
jgi:arginine exporter protein ArgO